MRESIVLLKNEADEKGKKLLPLEKTAKIAFIGPYVEDQDMRSSWAVVGGPDNMVSIRAAAEECFDENQVSFHQGCTLLDNGTLINLGYYEEENWEEKNKQLLSEALESAKEARYRGAVPGRIQRSVRRSYQQSKYHSSCHPEKVVKTSAGGKSQCGCGIV